jgi:hypothetical protein
VDFEIIGEVTEIETIAVGNSIHELNRLRKIYGRGRWRKLKGVATIMLVTGKFLKVEIHWYEASGIGKKEYKIKHILDDKL